MERSSAVYNDNSHVSASATLIPTKATVMLDSGPITPNFPSGSSRKISGDYVEK